MDHNFPLKNLARALRRHHAARVKKNRSGYWGRDRGITDPLSERQLGILERTRALCSGFCCGSPRRWFGELTLQEQRWHVGADEACLVVEVDLARALSRRGSRLFAVDKDGPALKNAL